MAALRPLPGVERTSSVVIHAARICEYTAWLMSMAEILVRHRTVVIPLLGVAPPAPFRMVAKTLGLSAPSRLPW